MRLDLETATAIVIREAGSRIAPDDLKCSAEALATGFLDGIFNITWILHNQAELLARCNHRPKDLKTPLKMTLTLLDAVEAGLGAFIPGPPVVAIPRPTLP